MAHLLLSRILQAALVDYCQSKGIVVVAYGLMGSRTNQVLQNSTILDVARETGMSPAAVVMGWARSKSLVVLVGSSNPEHIEQNATIYKTELSKENVARIDLIEDQVGRCVMGWNQIPDLDAVDIADPAVGDQW